MSVLEVRGATVAYRREVPGDARDTAVDDVTFAVGEREMVGLVGESGCGKTTLGRAILGLVPLTAGEVHWDGRRIDALRPAEFRPLRRALQCVFQDPEACLDPRLTIAESVAEPLRALFPELTGKARAGRALARLAEVGLGDEFAGRYPHQLSGGQLQRAGIARALVVDPQFVVCDEPVSALDVTVQGQILALLERVRRERRLASLFISHNLAVVARVCERVLVMFKGRVVEAGPRQALLVRPRHPYTRALLDAVPAVDAGARARLGMRTPAPAPSPMEGAGTGCPFAGRCRLEVACCRTERPLLRPLESGHAAACHRADEWPAGVPPAAP